MAVMWLHENINVVFDQVYALSEKIKLNRGVIGEKRWQRDTDGGVVANAEDVRTSFESRDWRFTDIKVYKLWWKLYGRNGLSEHSCGQGSV